MLTDQQIFDAGLLEWRKLGQGLHAYYRTDGFSTGARFAAAIGAAGDTRGHHPRVTIGADFVDLKLISTDAIYRDGEGREHVVEWTTQADIEMARQISKIAAEQAVVADPAAIATIELALDTAHAALLAPVWAALLTGSTDARGRGTIGDDVRDDTGRMPILWFQGTDDDETPWRSRFHLDIWVPYDVATDRIAAAVAAAGVITDDSHDPSDTAIADQDGNKGCVAPRRPPPMSPRRPAQPRSGPPTRPARSRDSRQTVDDHGELP